MDSAKYNSLFFKFFTLPDRNQTLRLPQAWTKYMGDRLPQAAFLRNKYGDMWLVSVAEDKTTKRYSFEDGWRTFVEQNKVEYKDKLVFKFDGISTFDFKLFGRNNREKEYVRLSSIKREEDILPEPEERHNNVELQLVVVAEPAEEGLGQDIQMHFEDEFIHQEPRPKRKKGTKRARAITVADEEAVFRKAGIPRPENPYFLTKKRPNRNVMYIPREIVKDYMLSFPEEVIIRDEKGRDWKTPVQKWEDGRMWLSKGWTSYCRRNFVGLDDWCVIEIVKPETPGADIYFKARLVPKSELRVVESS